MKIVKKKAKKTLVGVVVIKLGRQNGLSPRCRPPLLADANEYTHFEYKLSATSRASAIYRRAHNGVGFRFGTVCPATNVCKFGRGGKRSPLTDHYCARRTIRFAIVLIAWIRGQCMTKPLCGRSSQIYGPRTHCV